MHYLLTYDLAPDYLERRGQFRDAHLELAWAAQQRGELVIAGALVEPSDQAVLVFSCATPEPVQLFAARDPYVTHGLVRAFHVRQWNTVVGDAAFNPVRPGQV
ncbi:YciI-like protein [Massilia sp. H6]|uniref:YciI-like protein n=1 Tax=Massilia sp. H6 TaxID=2970464 RepID=UPI0021698813|nr:YciI-like protein [Massilia sp. H6]UVW29599.1 YciI-like protein [Massilia sp. H6]